MSGAVSGSAAEYVETLRGALAAIDASAVERYADALFAAWRDRRSVWLMGNGGSASTASHHVCDYVKTAMVEGAPRLRAFSLVDNTELLTALGNDLSYEETLRFPLESYAEEGDIATVISCSGNSPNILAAAEHAKGAGLTLVALTGFAGGKVGPMADIHINVASDNYGVIEDAHLAVGHMVCHGLHGRIRAQRGV